MADAVWQRETTGNAAAPSYSVSVNSTDANSEALALRPLKASVLQLDVASGDTITVEVCVDQDMTRFTALTDGAGTAYSTTCDDTITLSPGFTGIRILGGSQGTSTVGSLRQF